MVDVSLLSQQDPRWKNTPLGSSSVTIGGYGCLLTSMTMVANYYGFNETPATVNDKMKAVGGFQDALIMPYLFPKALPGMVYRDFVNCESSAAPMAEIDADLGLGKPVIVEVDYAPNAGLQNHWIVLTGKTGEDYTLADPWPFPCATTPETLLTSRYRFGGTPAQIIRAVVYLEGGTPPAPPPIDLDTGVRASFPVYATADGLAMRTQTVVADYTLIKRVGLGTKLTILEADEKAKPKIGVLNQWIPVLDPADGKKGWTAAWYVSMSSPDIMRPPRPRPNPVKPANLIVKTTDEGVALRTKPEISEATLVKRVPVNTELVCTEPYAAAAAKVGVVYQWLPVKDVTNCQYYVAAWYVKAVNGMATLGVQEQGTVSFALESAEPEPTIVRAAVEGLAFRTRPLIMKKTLIRRAAVDSEFLVLEDPATAEPKIGKMGEWLHVRDVKGRKGYVAAWYVVRRPALVLTEQSPLPG